MQLITVFDADMVCSTKFFMKTLPRVVDDRVSLVLTPQAYHNYDPATDIFNHSAFAYWSMMVPGEDAWGHIVCTGMSLLSAKMRNVQVHNMHIMYKHEHFCRFTLYWLAPSCLQCKT